jgi:hypothetical protein
MKDMTPIVELKVGRVSDTQLKNPDSDELWRVTVEVYRAVNVNSEGKMTVDAATTEPVNTFQTYVCTAHR